MRPLTANSSDSACEVISTHKQTSPTAKSYHLPASIPWDGSPLLLLSHLKAEQPPCRSCPSPWGPADLRHGDNSGRCPALWVPGGRWDLVPGFCSVKPILSVFPSKSGAKHEFCPSSPKVCCQGALEISASGQALKLSLSLSSTTSFGSRKSCSCNCKLSSVRKGGNVVLSTEIFIDLFLPVPVGQTLQLARRASYVF